MAKLSKEKIELLESYVNRAKELMQETDEMRNQFERDFAAELSAKVYYASHLHRDIREGNTQAESDNFACIVGIIDSAPILGCRFPVSGFLAVRHILEY